MKEFSFEISNTINVTVNASDKEEARMKIIDDIDNFADMLINDCYVSDGEEL